MDALTLLSLSEAQPRRAMVYQDLTGDETNIECAACSYRKNEMVADSENRREAFEFTRLADNGCHKRHCDHCNSPLEFE